MRKLQNSSSFEEDLINTVNKTNKYTDTIITINDKNNKPPFSTDTDMNSDFTSKDISNPDFTSKDILNPDFKTLISRESLYPPSALSDNQLKATSSEPTNSTSNLLFPDSGSFLLGKNLRSITEGNTVLKTKSQFNSYETQLLPTNEFLETNNNYLNAKNSKDYPRFSFSVSELPNSDFEQSLLGSSVRNSRDSSTFFTPNPGNSDYNIPQFDPEKESSKEILLEVIPVLIICIFGSILAGYTFNRVRKLESFIDAPGLYMMVPMLLNLKGNIETNFATRLATLANTGYFVVKSRRNAEIQAGITLILFQAFAISVSTAVIVCSLIPIIALDDIVPSKLSWTHQSLIISFASITSSLIGCLINGSLASSIVVLCLKFGIDSDNVTGPIIASFGDLMTIILISKASTFSHLVHPSITILLLFIYLIIGFFLFRATKSQPLVSSNISKGWGSLLYAFVTSTIAGALLERYVALYSLLAGLSPVFNGTGGNIAVIFVSRLSTSLHSGTVSAKSQSKNFLILFVANLPVQTLFLVGCAAALFAKITNWPILLFSFYYIAASSLHVTILLIIGSIGAKAYWARDKDPDFYINPIM
ncbi:Solute carrier family 41 member 1 [Smittium culicis]|uniref:Solute carrier family 41 member 1 n=1 Tax=Smittium culicis TaxID=133412 RepID=A0A1R1XU55_9FUNG|nr:Solute carrier family 41 member 1 [Smittium culicis]